MPNPQTPEPPRVTDGQIAEWERQLAALVRAPWSVERDPDAKGDDDDTSRVAICSADKWWIAKACFYVDGDADGRQHAEFIAESPTIVATLIAEVKRLKAALEATREYAPERCARCCGAFGEVELRYFLATFGPLHDGCINVGPGFISATINTDGRAPRTTERL